MHKTRDKRKGERGKESSKLIVSFLHSAMYMHVCF